MTKIIRLTTAEWKARQLSRSKNRSHRMGVRTSNIIIFPGVRVEYHDTSCEMRNPFKDHIGKKVSRLQFHPVSGKLQE